MRPARVFAGPASLLLAFVLGCASSPTAAPPITPLPAVSPLAGNWLLNGSLPAAGNSVLGKPSSGGTASFDVVGQSVTASANLSFACGTSGFNVGLGTTLTGTIQKDGSFVLTLPTPLPINNLQAVITGHVPAAAGDPWSGIYTVTETQPGFCTPAQLTGVIAATPIADFTGTWIGQGTYQQPTPGSGSFTSSALSMTVNLTQGAPLSSLSTTISRLGLSGSIQMSGIPCFTKGTSSAPSGTRTLGNYVEGSVVHLDLSMDDGSVAGLDFSTQDAANSKLALTNLIVASGKCAGSYLFFNNPLILQKQ